MNNFLAKDYKLRRKVKEIVDFGEMEHDGKQYNCEFKVVHNDNLLIVSYDPFPRSKKTAGDVTIDCETIYLPKKMIEIAYNMLDVKKRAEEKQKEKIEKSLEKAEQLYQNVVYKSQIKNL